MGLDRERLEERQRQVVADLEELLEQVELGELEPETAEHLRNVYEEELAEIRDALGHVVDTPVVPKQSNTRAVPKLSYSVAIGGAVVLGILTGLIVLLASRSGSAEPTAETGSGATVAAGAIDVEGMSVQELEESLANFPESATVRLALADRYIAADELTTALEHYLIVSSTGQATDQERGHALARIGYLSYATGQHQAARDTLLDSLNYDADNTEALLYLGYVYLNGFQDRDTAAGYFERALEDPRVPPDVVAEVNELLGNAVQGDG
jgi:tetratricopeptide (TPR) repeat protein